MNGDPDRIRDRVAGRLRYAIDVAVDGMLHAALVRSPLAAGRLVGVDTSAAARLPGVRAVVTAADLARLPLVDRRFGTIVPDQPILAADRVSHVGEPVAAVVADTEDVARRAARLVRLEIVPERAVLDVESALAPGAPTVNERAPDNVLGRWGYRNGDLDAARASTRRIFVGEYTSPAAQQVTLESQVCVARWIAGRLELWAATQSPSRVAAELARLFGLPDEAVRVVVPPLGGGYGAKNHAKLEPLAAALAALLERPVRIANRRAEEFVTTTKHPAIVRLESGVDGAGRFTYRRATIRWSAGAYAHSSPAVMRAGALAVCGPYRVRAAEVESVMVYTNLPPAGSFRGLGANQAVWAGERQVDEIAVALGVDPLEFRRRNLVRSGERLPTGDLVADAHWIDCLEAVAAALGGGGATGIAVAMKHTMTPSRSEALVAALPDGTLEVRSSLVDMGQGLRSVLVRAAAAALDVPEALVHTIDPDTARTGFDSTTSSSRGAWAGSVAVSRAATALRASLEAAAAALVEAPAGSVRLTGGRFVDATTARPLSVSLADVVRSAGAGELIGHGVAENEAQPDPETGRPVSSSHWHQGAVGVRVEVDDATGVLAVRDAVGAAWAGRVLDAGRARLQTEGGIVFGLGPALFEELAFPGGTPSASSLLDYRIPSIRDLPGRLVTVELEEHDGEPVGLGESVIPAVAPAVAGAVASAIGGEWRTLPLTPDRLVSASRPALSAGPYESPAPEPGGEGAEEVAIDLTVDGRAARLSVDPLEPLQRVLAERLGIRSVRAPCGVGVCGACSVEVDGRVVRSCLRPVGLLDGSVIRTAEGLPPDDPVREAFVAAGAAQCGYCIPGTVMAVRDLLHVTPEPGEADLREALAGNLCRCGTYARILDAARAARDRNLSRSPRGAA